MKYFILAGEKSGDLHGSNLIREIKLIDPNAIIKGWGGDYMKNQGAEILIHHTELAIMGLLGVIQNLKKLKKNFSAFKNQLLTLKPDKVIFIDYGKIIDCSTSYDYINNKIKPFNLRLSSYDKFYKTLMKF